MARALRRRPCAKLTQLDFSGNAIGNEGCARLALSLKEGCPDLRELNLDRIGIDALPDTLSQLRSLTDLSIQFNGVTAIQPALYDLILQLENFESTGTPLSDDGRGGVNGVDELKNHIRAERRRRGQIRSCADGVGDGSGGD